MNKKPKLTTDLPRIPSGARAETERPNAARNPEIKTVTIEVPIAPLTDGGEYQNSHQNPPRQLRARNLSPREGRALGAVRLGMLANDEHLDGEKFAFGTGQVVRRKVESKEQAVSRLLELIAKAIEQQ